MNNVFVELSNHTYEQLMGLLEQRDCGGKMKRLNSKRKNPICVIWYEEYLHKNFRIQQCVLPHYGGILA
jgi:hypothetical protein